MSMSVLGQSQDTFRTFSDNNNGNPNNNTNNKKSHNNNIIIIKNTQPGVRITAEDGERIVTAYVSAIGTGITPYVARFIEQFIEQNHTVEQVLDAIERTGWARRPSPQYLRTVLNNYDQQRSNNWWEQQPNTNDDNRNIVYEYMESEEYRAKMLKELKEAYK